MKVIFKYTLLDAHTQLYLPSDAKFLCLQTQRQIPQMWFVVDMDKQDDLVQRNFIMRPTGEPYHESINEVYVGTFQGLFVFHVFELM